MKYIKPLNEADPTAPYIDGDASQDIEGSEVPAAAIEQPMREIMNVITGAGIEPDGEDLAQMFAAIQSMIVAAIAGIPPADTVPVGSIIPCPSITPWSGFYLLDGSILPRANDPDLFAYANSSGNIIDDASWTLATSGSFSRGDGSTTFRLPDYRGVGLRGFDAGRGLDTGRLFGTYQADQMQQITGSVETFINPVGTPQAASGAFSFIGTGAVGDGGSNSRSRFRVGFDSANSPNARVGSETRMKNTAVNFCIKY